MNKMRRKIVQKVHKINAPVLQIETSKRSVYCIWYLSFATSKSYCVYFNNKGVGIIAAQPKVFAKQTGEIVQILDWTLIPLHVDIWICYTQYQVLALHMLPFTAYAALDHPVGVWSSTSLETPDPPQIATLGQSDNASINALWLILKGIKLCTMIYVMHIPVSCMKLARTIRIAT